LSSPGSPSLSPTGPKGPGRGWEGPQKGPGRGGTNLS